MPDSIKTPASPVGIVLVSGRAEDCEQLVSILRDTRWHLIAAGDVKGAFHMLSAVELPIVLWDRDTPGMEWRHGLRELAGMRQRPAAMLLSDVTDSYLWEEVVRAGGFDVLTRPFRTRDVLAALEFAYRHWESARREVRTA